MSTEALAITAVVQDGVSALRKLYGAGISQRDFVVYEEEFHWIEKRLAAKKSMNTRVFRRQFPDFEMMRPEESLDDLASELKEERAFEEVNQLVATMTERLEQDNAVELALEARDRLAAITRQFSPMADIDLDDWEDAIEEMRKGFILAKQGISLGIPTGFRHLDHHWGGFMPGQLIGVLGRTGEGKSLKTTAFGWSGKKEGFKVGMFTPEHSTHEVRCRYHTLASADKDIQKALGLKRSFRNRALLFRRGFNLKQYQQFCEYLKDELPGRFHLLSGTKMPGQMTVGYIEDRIVELELDFVIIDPIYLLKPVRMSSEGNPYLEVGWTVEAVHHLGEQYNIPIVFTNQAHMEGGAKDDAPHKDRSFGSKAMMHIADYVLGVKNVSDEGRMICRGTKSRFGQDFRYEMRFLPNVGVFKDLTPIKGSYFNGTEDTDDDELKEMIEAAAGTGQEVEV